MYCYIKSFASHAECIITIFIILSYVMISSCMHLSIVLQTYGTMHRKANEVFVCIREGFICACSQKCREADVMFIPVYTVYPVWFIFI